MLKLYDRLPLPADSTTMPMQTKLQTLDLFCKAMLFTGQHHPDPHVNLRVTDEVTALARLHQCDMTSMLRLASRGYNWIRLLAQTAQPNLPLLAAAENAATSGGATPEHILRYESERRSMTLQMILEIIHIYTDEVNMEPTEFKYAALIVSLTLQQLGMGARTEQDIINGAAQHLRWIFPSISTRVLNGFPLTLFPSESANWPFREETSPYAGLRDEHSLGILDAELQMLQRASSIHRLKAMAEEKVDLAIEGGMTECPQRQEPWDIMQQDQDLRLTHYGDHLIAATDLLDADDHQQMTADLQIGRSWLRRPIEAADVVSLEVLWHNTTVPDEFARSHLTLQLRAQIATHVPEDKQAQNRLYTIISPQANEVIDQRVPWILAFKMLTPQRRAVFLYAIKHAAGLLPAP